MNLSEGRPTAGRDHTIFDKHDRGFRTVYLFNLSYLQLVEQVEQGEFHTLQIRLSKT